MAVGTCKGNLRIIKLISGKKDQTYEDNSKKAMTNDEASMMSKVDEPLTNFDFVKCTHYLDYLVQ